MFTQSAVNVITSASFYALLALSFVLVFRILGFLNVSHAVPFVVAPYVTLALLRLRLGFLAALGIGLLAAIAVSSIITYAVFEKMRRRGASSLTLLLASLGVYVVVVNAISLVFGNDPTTLPTGEASVFSLGSGRVTLWQFVAMVSCVVTFILSGCLMRFTTVGKVYRAAASDAQLATICGLPLAGIRLGAVAIASGVAGYTGILASLDTAMEPGMALNALLLAVVVSILGGGLPTHRIILSALALSTLQTVGAWFASAQWQNTIAFAVLIVLLLFRPNAFSRGNLTHGGR